MDVRHCSQCDTKPSGSDKGTDRLEEVPPHFLVAGFLFFTIKPKVIYPFPSGHRAASACFATASQNSRLAKAWSGIKGVERSRRQALPAKRSAGLQNPKPLQGVLGCKTLNP